MEQAYYEYICEECGEIHTSNTPYDVVCEWCWELLREGDFN